jgi:hypothetical protein
MTSRWLVGRVVHVDANHRLGVVDILRKDLGITTPGLSRFKPGIYTYIGVYSGNPWGLRPAL